MNCITEAHHATLDVRWKLGNRQGIVHGVPVPWGINNGDQINWNCRAAWRSNRIGLLLRSPQLTGELRIFFASDITTPPAGHIFESRIHYCTETEAELLWQQDVAKTLKKLYPLAWL